jgi:DNA-binding SARP family transcriptional activator
MEAPTLSIRLFGGLDLRYGDRALPPLASARVETLLAYLLLHRHGPQSRQHLAFLLWPDSTEAQARTNLRHVLHDLRRALPDADRFLDVTDRTLQWRPEAPYRLDVDAFEVALSRIDERDEGRSLTARREAVEWYSGDLFDGCYDDWLLAERERLRTRYLEALSCLARGLAQRGDLTAAIAYADRLASHDPVNEEAYRLLMRLHAAQGQRARALQIYHRCSAALERTLGVEPSPATRETYETLLPTAVDSSEALTSLRAVRADGASLIGRLSEWARLTSLWRDTERGCAHVVLVAGEAGVGKTRLVEELRAWCARRGAATAHARSYAAEGSMAYGPVASWLHANAFAAQLGHLDRDCRFDLAPLLPDRLPRRPNGDTPVDAGIDQRQRLFHAISRALLPPGRSVLLVADDIHWCDTETMQFLHYLLRQEPNVPLLVVMTARREDLDERHPLSMLLGGLRALECLTEIELGPLGREETAALAQQVSGRPWQAAAADRLFEETEGNPLFVVEALRAGWTADSDHRWMSPKVQAAIEDRLAQLSVPTRALVGLAATIGREFTPDVLALASQVDEETLVRGLDELWRRRIVREQGSEAYYFSHDKIREVAYLALSPAQRRHGHLRIASALETLHAHDPGMVSGSLAAHYERAGAAEAAITWYERAADAAQQVYANSEAVRLLDRSLDLIRAQATTPARQERELALLTALQVPLGAVEGHAAERLHDTQRRAGDLARMLGVELAAPLLRSVAIARLAQGDFAAARQAGRQLHARGARDADDVLLVEGEYVLGISAFWQGELTAARAHFETAVARERPELRREHLDRYGLDPKVICLSRLGNTLWFLGHPVAATRARDAALNLADEIGHPFSRATALVFATLLSLELGDIDGFRVFATALAAMREEEQTKPTRVAAEAFTGYIDVVDGSAAAGVARLERALEEGEAANHAPGHYASNLRLLLAAYAFTQEAERGLAVAERLLGVTAVRLWETEARRLRAEFLAARGAVPTEVEAELQRALQVAQQQGAIALALRVANSTARLRRQWGEDGAAREADELAKRLMAEMPERVVV